MKTPQTIINKPPTQSSTIIHHHNKNLSTFSELPFSPFPTQNQNLKSQTNLPIDHNPMIMSPLPSDQIKQLKDIFTRFDMNSDGSLTHLELAALLRSIGLKPQGDQIHALLASMDSNGNGSIEFEELLEVLLPDLNEEVLINHDQLMEVFRSFDKDGNGYITAAELAGQMAEMGQPLSYKELTEMIREADANGDGVISFSEFTAILGRSAAGIFGVTAA
ncbi:putative EF-hand domain-containing protein [Helianthus debilis subsp. tardiflorus]